MANKELFTLGITLTETLPIKALQAAASLTNNNSWKKQGTFMNELSNKMFNMQKLFYHFFNNTWYYGNENTDLVWDMMSSEERKMFKI